MVAGRLASLLCVASAATKHSARVVRYGASDAMRASLAMNTGARAAPVQLPAYVLLVDERPEAMLFYDARVTGARAVSLMYNKVTMGRPGYFNSFRRLLDRSDCVHYDDLPLSDWMSLVAWTEPPEF